MTAWEAWISKRRGEFLEGLAADGFVVDDESHAHGELEIRGRDARVPLDITLPEFFPYAIPKVRPTDGSGGLSWHRERDGSLCLYAAEESGDLPWLADGALVERIREWFARDADGWSGDPPDLDLERYFAPAERDRLLVYGELASGGSSVRVRRMGDVLETLPGAVPAKAKRRGAEAGQIVDIGELDVPIRTWHDLLDRAGDQRQSLVDGVAAGDIDVLFVKYTRDARAAVLVLEVANRAPVAFRAIEATQDTATVRHLRAGLDRDLLRDKRVAIVGVGAVGSFLADLLARVGVGTIMLVDSQFLTPGNCVRHLAGNEHAGKRKVEAVRDVLESAGIATGQQIAVSTEAVSSTDQATDLICDYDLVLDATASGTTSALLLDGARALDTPVVSVCVQRDGGIARVDRVPSRAGEAHLDPVPVVIAATAPLYEAGCGDPISSAPAWACAVAAGLAADLAADVLTGREQLPSTIVQVLIPQGDTPYDHVGTLTS